MSKLSKRAFKSEKFDDYIDPIEDSSHPGYEVAKEREADVYREFLESQPKKKGKEISVCPNCFKTFKEREVNIEPLSEWAFKNGVAFTKTSKGCPDCDPKNYDESKDPNSESAIAKQKEEIEKERENKKEKNRLWWKKFNEDGESIGKFFDKYYEKHPELKPEEKEVSEKEEYEYWADDSNTKDEVEVLTFGAGVKVTKLNGKKHSFSDGPAVDMSKSNGNLEWYSHGERHRTKGPAVIYGDGREEYWVNGKELSKEEFMKDFYEDEIKSLMPLKPLKKANRSALFRWVEELEKKAEPSREDRFLDKLDKKRKKEEEEEEYIPTHKMLPYYKENPQAVEQLRGLFEVTLSGTFSNINHIIENLTSFTDDPIRVKAIYDGIKEAAQLIRKHKTSPLFVREKLTYEPLVIKYGYRIVFNINKEGSVRVSTILAPGETHTSPRSQFSEDEEITTKTAESLEEKLNQSEILETKEFNSTDVTLVQHIKDSLTTLINSSQNLFELNLLTQEELNVIKTIEENMDDYLLAEQWGKFARLKAFLKVVNSNVRNRTLVKLGQLRGSK